MQSPGPRESSPAAGFPGRSGREAQAFFRYFVPEQEKNKRGRAFFPRMDFIIYEPGAARNMRKKQKEPHHTARFSFQAEKAYTARVTFPERKQRVQA